MTEKNESPFVHNWTDENTKELYKFHAAEVYEQMKKMRETSLQAQYDWGKWLIASMLAIHGGAIYALSNIYKDFKGGREPIIEALTMNVSGIVAIMVCGFMTWLNYQFVYNRFSNFADPAMTYRKDAWPKSKYSKTDPINATYFLSIAFGIFSLFFFVQSGMIIVRGLHN